MYPELPYVRTVRLACERAGIEPAAVLGVLVHNLTLSHFAATADHEQSENGHVPPWGIRDVVSEVRGEASQAAQITGKGDPDNPDMPPSVLSHLLLRSQNRLLLERYNLGLARRAEAEAGEGKSKQDASSRTKWQEHLIAPLEVLVTMLQEFVNEQARLSLHADILMEDEARRRKPPQADDAGATE